MATKNPDPITSRPYLDDVTISEVREHPDNPRKTIGDIAELAASVKAHGVLEPIVVQITPEIADTPGNDLPKRIYQLISGHRRLAAAKRAGLTTVPAIVHTIAADRAAQIELMLTENVQREDLTAIEEGDSYALLLDLGVSLDHLTKSLGKPKTHIKERVKAAGLPEATRERIIRGQVTLEHAARMQPFAKNPDVMERLDKAAEAGPLALDRAIVEEQHAADRAKARAAVKRDLRSRGRTISTVLDAANSDSVRLLMGLYGWPEDDDPRLPEQAAQMTPSERDEALKAIVEQQHFDEHPDAHTVTVEDPFVPGGPVRVYGWCLAPSFHATGAEAETAPETDEQSAAREQREAEQKADQERLAKLAAAGVVRRRFLGEVAMSDAAPKLAKEVLLKKFDQITKTQPGTYAFDDLVLFSQVILPDLSAANRSDEKLGSRVRKALEARTVDQLAVLGEVLFDLRSGDADLDRGYRMAWAPLAEVGYQHPAAKYRARLTDFWGYEWSDIEQEMLERHAGAEDED